MKLTNICLFNFDIKQQSIVLEEFNILPFKLRLFYRLNLLIYKVMNQIYLKKYFDYLKFNNKSHLRNTELLDVPFEGTKFGMARLSIFLPRFVNIVMKNSFNLKFRDFNEFLKLNLLDLYKIFIAKFY